MLSIKYHTCYNSAVAVRLVLLLSLFTAGCKKFVVVGLPSSNLTAPAVFESASTAEAALTNIYVDIRDNSMLTGGGFGSANLMGLYSDEFDQFDMSYLGGLNFYQNGLLPSNPQIATWWNGGYNIIYSCNALIEGLDKSVSLDTAIRRKLTGEALFCRSLIHFYLVNLFGEIPYITTTDYLQNANVSRSSYQYIYDQLVSDLMLSSELMGDAYPTAERTRPNRTVAHALLARVYLYSGDWEKAETASSFCIDQSSSYPWETDLSAIFLKGSSVTLWQMKPSSEGANSNEGGISWISDLPPNKALSLSLLSAFEPLDQRRQLWVDSVTDGAQTWYHVSKYKQYKVENVSTEYSIILRLAEQYLIRAEARARLNKIQGAREDLDRIRVTAGLLPTSANSTEDLLNAIMQERRVELFTEGPHRFFDLKRMSQLDAVLSSVKPGWDVTDSLIPIPEVELTLNPALAPQNEGY